MAIALGFVSQSLGFALGQSTKTISTPQEALAAIRSKYGVLTGFEMAPNDSEHTPITVDLSTKDIGPALGSLVAQRPLYRWVFQDGVYDVFPRAETDSVSSLAIQTYSLKDALLLVRASDALSELPEVQGWLSQKHLIRQELSVGPGLRSGHKVSLTLNNVPLRVILNHLATEFGATQWMVMRYSGQEEYIGFHFYNN